MHKLNKLLPLIEQYGATVVDVYSGKSPSRMKLLDAETALLSEILKFYHATQAKKTNARNPRPRRNPR